MKLMYSTSKEILPLPLQTGNHLCEVFILSMDWNYDFSQEERMTPCQSYWHGTQKNGTNSCDKSEYVWAELFKKNLDQPSKPVFYQVGAYATFCCSKSY